MGAPEFNEFQDFEYITSAKPGKQSDFYVNIRADLYYNRFFKEYHLAAFKQKPMELREIKIPILDESQDLESLMNTLQNPKSEDYPKALRDLYDINLAFISKPGADKMVYSQLLEAYVSILRECDLTERIRCALTRVVERRFDKTKSFGYLELKKILEDASSDEKRVEDEKVLRMFPKGVSNVDLIELKEKYIWHDEFRKKFHQEIIAYAERLGFSEMDVASEIATRFLGDLFTLYKPEESMLHLQAGTISVQENDDDYPRQMFIDFDFSNRQATKQALKKYKGFGNAKYNSHMNVRKGDELKDAVALHKFAQQNPDVSMVVKFIRFRNLHSIDYYKLSAVVNMDELAKTEVDPAKRLELLIEDFQKYCKRH